MELKERSRIQTVGRRAEVGKGTVLVERSSGVFKHVVVASGNLGESCRFSRTNFNVLRSRVTVQGRSIDCGV